ncbi:MAG: CpXC domain-containing protein [Sphaerochaeta sp.]|uniref:CpXC domain-containing protein n=1 Tax=Sphaerochaeta sp. TaxID=1972642 RepID=UPI002FC8E3F4
MHQATLACPHCHEQQSHTLHPFVDLAKQPKQKLAILTDSLFTVTCPACNRQFSVLHECLVVDETRKFAVLLAPQSESSELDNSFADGIRWETYTLRLVTDTASLKEKILLLDSELDDRTIELCKLYLSMQLDASSVRLFFAEHQHKEGQLLFSVINEQGALAGSLSVEAELYRQLLDTSRRFIPKEGCFSKVDAHWAMNQIKNNADH